MENNLDNFFKKKLDNREFDMPDAYWGEMEKMIEADEKGNDRKFLWTWLLGALLSLIVIGGSFWYFSGDSTSSSNPSITNTKVTPSSPQTQEATNLIEENKVSDTEVTSEAETDNSNNVIVDNSNNVNTKVNNAEFSSEQKQNTKNSSSNSNNNNVNKLTPKKYPTYSNGNTLIEKKVSSETNSSSTIILPNNSKEENLLDSKEVVSPSNKKTLKQQPTPSSIEKIEKKKKEVIRKSVASISNLPSLDLDVLTNDEREENLPDLDWINLKKKRFSMGLTAGIVSFPLEETSSNSISGSKVGLTARYKLKRNFALNADLMYFYKGGNYSPINSDDDITYSFGRMTDRYELTPKNVHYLEMPVYLTYTLKKHVFEGGISASYLLGVKGSTIKTSNEGQVSEVEDPYWLENSGFKNVLANAALGYRYQISPNLHFGVRAVYTPNKFPLLQDGSNISGPERYDVIENSPLHLNFKLTQYLF